MGETEVTEALYAAVSNTTTTKPYYPHVFSSFSSSGNFVENLNTLIKLSFKMPTKEEWQYAAKGGDKSQNYVYSGSNLITDVAWYSSNSNNQCHEVAQLMPNELGFYDMSGNLHEWTLTKYNSYGEYYFLGGAWNSTDSSCKVISYGYNSSNSHCGLRLALFIN
jgi:formylglycine-generating enzyme required for sulfatase activity